MARKPDADSLGDFERRVITLEAKTKPVFVAGDGPAVIVLAEMPGITPEVARFARYVRDAGFTVWMPVLFGRPGAPATPAAAAREIARACISREFAAFAAHRSSPVTTWLRALARHAHDACGGPGVGVIGMCFTGNFGLSMLLEPAVLAPVLSQPSLPLGRGSGIHLAPAERDAVAARLAHDDLSILAYRFAGDPFCPAARFDALQAAFGDRFEGHTLPDSAANPAAPKPVHSVVTMHLIDREGEPTRAAVEEILAFFARRLRPDHPTAGDDRPG